MATTTTGASSIIGQAEQDFDIYNPFKAQGSSELDKEDFLTLLVAQLSNQDPLNPMEDKEFTAQLAQFSQLEQLTNISSGIDKMTSADTRDQMFNAVSFIGKQVRASGESVSKDGDNVSTLYFDLSESVADGYINVFDANGNMIRTDRIGAKTPGAYQYEWDGKDYQGNSMADGVYYIYMAAQNAEGEPVELNTDVSGEVVGVQTIDDKHYLRLKDGRVVDMTEIKEVVNPQAASETSTSETTTE